jgi:hypothetical protein
MDSRRDASRGIYLPSGIRVRGPGASRLTEQLGLQPQPPLLLSPGDSRDALFALICTAEPRTGARPAVEWILDALTEEIRQGWPECPRLTRDREVEDPPSRFGGVGYRVNAKPGRGWTGRLLWRSVHPAVPGVPITTQATLEETSSYTRLGVQVTAEGGLANVRGFIGAGQAQPPFLRRLQDPLHLTWMGTTLATQRLGSRDIGDFVTNVLGAPARTHPVVVLAPREDGGYNLDAKLLAWELLGRARLHVIHDPKSTYDLTDAVGGRTMSCFRGAARCYMPGWSRHDDPFEHPLLLGDQLDDPLLRAAWLGEVGMWMAGRVRLPEFMTAEVVEKAPEMVHVEAPANRDMPSSRDAEPAAESDARPGVHAEGPAEGPTDDDVAHVVKAPDEVPAPEGREEDGAARHDPLPAIHHLAEQVDALTRFVRDLLASHARLSGEVERLGTLSAVRSSSTNAIERRLGGLEELMERFFGSEPTVQGGQSGHEMAGIGTDGSRGAATPSPAASAEDEGRLTVAQVVADVAEVHDDALAVLDAALEAAGDSPYEDAERVRAVLDAMAQVARRRRDGILGISLREAFGSLGIDYRSGIAQTTSARLRQQYQFTSPAGEPFEAEEHIVLGNTYDPRRCLRIYFSSRVAGEARFVIGHVGRHFEVMTST